MITEIHPISSAFILPPLHASIISFGTSHPPSGETRFLAQARPNPFAILSPKSKFRFLARCHSLLRQPRIISATSATERSFERTPFSGRSILWIDCSAMTCAAALTASLACPGIASPVTSTRRVRGLRPSICALSSRRTVQWRAQSQSDKAPAGSPKTGETNEPTPSWAKPGTEELPPWARNEAAAPVNPSGGVPFPVYLIGSCLVAIAAVGSIFEYVNQNPIFGVVQPDSPLWAPILGVFAFTGFPSAGFLFYKAISLANKASEEADRADGFDP